MAHRRLQAFGPVLALASLLALLWGVVLVYAVVQERRFVENFRQELRLINSAVVQQTRGLLQGVDSNLDVLRHWIASHPGADPRQDAGLAELMARMSRGSEGLVSYGLLAADGWPTAAPQTGIAQLGAPVRGSASQPWRWPMSRRLDSPAPGVAGVVGWIDLARLGSLHETLRQKPAGAISLVTSSGLLVMRTPAIEGLVGRDLSANRPPLQPAGVAQGYFEHSGTLTGGQPRLASFERLGSYPVTVLVSQEVDEVLAAFHLRLQMGIAVLVLITAAGIAFSVLLARSQRATRRGQAEVAAINEALPLGLFRTDTTGTTLYANDAYLHTLGTGPERLAWGWSEWLPAQERDSTVAAWRASAAQGRPVSNVLTLHPPGRSEMKLSVHTAPLHVDGRLIGQVGSVEDITGRVQQQQARRMLTAIFEQSTDVVAQVGPQGHMLYLNPAGRALLALGPADPVSHLHYDDFLPAHREQQVREVIMPAAMAQGLWVGETSVLCGNGREIDVSEMLIVHRDENQAIEAYSVVMRDITKDLRHREELQRSESVLKIVAATLPVLVAVVDREQRYLFTNDAFVRWIGGPHPRLAGLHAREVLGEAEYAHRQPYIEAALAGQRVMFETHRDGKQYFETTYMPFRGADGQVAGLVSLSQDITAHKRQQQALLDASQTDALTGALNRAGFDLRMREALARAQQGEQVLALLCIDLDRFKPVNDEHGHATGDALLVAVAQRLRQVLRPTDVLARLGGDEFAVVLADARSEAAVQTVAHKIVGALAAPYGIEHKTLNISASVGVALARSGHDTMQTLMQRADAALYQAKRAGRSRYEIAAGTW